jgi:hypothetical protein
LTYYLCSRKKIGHFLEPATHGYVPGTAIGGPDAGVWIKGWSFSEILFVGNIVDAAF